jgi:hypothetical protein
MFFQCFTKPWARAPAMMMVKNVMVASAAVTHGVVQQVEDVEDRNQTDGVGAQDEDEERHQQRRVGVHPLVADVGPHDRLADEVHHGFERVHEARRNLAVLAQVSPHRERDDEENRRGHQPQHQHVLGDGEIDTEDRREMDERLRQRAVGDVLDDRLAGVEGRGRVFGGVPGGFF